jgi:hypothetical protein
LVLVDLSICRAPRLSWMVCDRSMTKGRTPLQSTEECAECSMSLLRIRNQRYFYSDFLKVLLISAVKRWRRFFMRASWRSKTSSTPSAGASACPCLSTVRYSSRRAPCRGSHWRPRSFRSTSARNDPRPLPARVDHSTERQTQTTTPLHSYASENALKSIWQNGSNAPQTIISYERVLLRDSGHPKRYLCHRQARLSLEHSPQSLSTEYYGVFNRPEIALSGHAPCCRSGRAHATAT